jgi:hypothetical protein
MAIRPHIVHVVGYPEADHAVNGVEVIESCRMAQRAIEQAMLSKLDLTVHPNVQRRADELLSEAQVLIAAIQNLDQNGVTDPLADTEVLARAVQTGLLDAPQLKNNPYGRGKDHTRIDSRGACVSVDPLSMEAILEKSRIEATMMRRQHG